MQTISTILNIILGLLSMYFYIENNKLRGYEIDKKIKIKEVEKNELNNKFEKDKIKLDEELNRKGAYFGGGRIKRLGDLKHEYENNLSKIDAELTYLEKLKKYKGIFSK